MTGISVKEAAQLMNVSERIVYMMRDVHKLRPDLADECAAGRMSANKAWLIAKGKKAPSKLEKLISGWNSADPETQNEFILFLSADLQSEGSGHG